MAKVTHAVATTFTTNITSYVSGAFTPVVGDLLVAFVMASDTVATGNMFDSLGGSWRKVASALARTSLDTLYCFVREQLIASPTSMTVTFDCTGDAATGSVIHVARVSGMDASGITCVRQTAKQDNQAAAGTPAPVFGQAALTGNVTFGFVGNATNPATLTPPASWTENADSGYATPTTGAEYVSRDSGFTGTTITWGGTSASAFGSLIVELYVNNPVEGGPDQLLRTLFSKPVVGAGSIPPTIGNRPLPAPVRPGPSLAGLARLHQTSRTFAPMSGTGNPPASFDPALMAAMDRPWRDIAFDLPTVAASGMAPPDLVNP